MNRDQNFVAFLSFFIFCVGIGSKTTDAQSNKIDETIVTEIGGNVTLLCNPSLRENATLSSLANKFEWAISDFGDLERVPIFSNGKLWPMLFEGDVDNSSFAIDSNPPATLILRKIITESIIFTCTISTPATKVSYTYLLKTPGRQRIPSFGTWDNKIPLKNRGHQVRLKCDANQVIKSSSDLSYYWLSRKSKPGEDVEDIEVISLNRSVLLKNSTKGFQVDEYRSLIVESLSPLWETSFECHLSNGAVNEYSTELNHYNESTTESRDWTVRNLKKHNFTVVYGTRNVVLPCPLTHNITNSTYIWFLSDPNGSVWLSDLLFLDQKKMAYTAKPSPDFYEINDDGSLVILAVKTYQYGKYVCQRSTGEQYVYNLNRGNKTISETISIKGKSTVTLPCPLEDEIDRDYNVFSWKLKSKNSEYYPGIYVINGATSNNGNIICDKAKLADDKTSLIVLNLTSSSIDDKYSCELFPSRNMYEYQFIN